MMQMLANNQTPFSTFLELTVNDDFQVTLPQEIGRKALMENNGHINVIVLDDLLLFVSKELETTKAAKEFEQIMAEEGVSLEDLLGGIAETRAELYRERYKQNG